MDRHRQGAAATIRPILLPQATVIDMNFFNWFAQKKKSKDDFPGAENTLKTGMSDLSMRNFIAYNRYS